MGWREAGRTAILTLLLAAGAAGLRAQGGGAAVSPPREPQSERLYLSFLGDIMIHTANYLTPDYDEIYTSLRPVLLRDTLSFANLEFPVDPSREYSSYPRFNAPREYLRAAVEAGIDVFSLANNHAVDQGVEGLCATLRSLEEVGRAAFHRVYGQGTRESLEQPFAPLEIRVKGLRVGFMAVTQVVNWPMPGPYVQIVDYANRRHREEFLPYVQSVAASYDLFILSYHGGREYAAEPEEAKVLFFRELLERGVDIVYGHHPHVLQRYELLERPEGAGLLLCSTGNLISGMTAGIDPREAAEPRARTGDSALWLVVVRAGGGRAAVEQVLPLPISTFRDRRGATGVRTFAALAGEGLPEPWVRYYRERHSTLRSLFRKWAGGGPSP